MIWNRNRNIICLLVLTLMICLFTPFDAHAGAHEVSIRSAFEPMGYKVILEGKNIKLVREKDEVIVLTPYSAKALKNGQSHTLNKAIRFDNKKSLNMISVLDVYGLAKPVNKEKHYRVKADDTLWKISRKFNVTVPDLKVWNSLDSDVIIPGQHLHTKNPIYIVKPGDSIWEIAHKTESTVNDLIATNKLTSDIVVPGQKLTIPLQPSVQPPNLFADGIFPLAKETYQPYGNSYGAGRDFSSDGKSRSHEGIDIMTEKWIPVFSAIEGTIVKLGWNTYGGYRITIKAPNGYTFYYAHLMGYPEGLNIGQWVSAGQLIGFTGDTGYGEQGTNGKFPAHLHFGMYDPQGNSINPYSYLKWWEMKP
ncbi:LysM peptidoglycan-binding domain-containing protein [Ureibacillus manganicus]|uniref:Metalloendopeptidase n=1 Tax=Ureibacillus manganicus DSM 26584 TaxID=1384049 RepID=A0A0A3I388_9BACL|nr:LysM peptidoglycan-binding domain-containing protein [Ureibacillus manganicus]KGR77133.1 hypothetical protein CD29_15670 [Ureibacillus manganicus DSM 26584]